MRDVAILGQGLHPWGKFADRSVTQMCRTAVEAALADAGMKWRQIEAVAAASSRFSGGKGWGLNGNDIVEDMGSTGIPVYNLSAGCAAGANAFNVGHMLVASGQHDVVLVMGGEKMPKGFIQTSGLDDVTDPEYLRQRCVGLPGPGFWALLCRQRMAQYGTSEEDLAAIAVKAHKLGALNEYARFRKEFTLDEVLNSAMVNFPLRLYEICPVSDGAAAVVLCSPEIAKQAASKPVWVAASAVATASFDDGIPRHLACTIGEGNAHHSEAKTAVEKAMNAAGVEPGDIDLIELQDNTVYYELAFPEEWGFIEPGTAEQWVAKGETMPTGKLPINPSGGFQSFGEATTAQALWQIVEVAWQLRGEAGARQVPNAKIGLAQSLGLGGNATATVLRV
ncbi:MAG: transporter [Deltaproteobacteria bacterium]|nr:transporter [Deltaproteobacteria bacterium]MBW2386838.1 transporter [Deltaproteobacteria bacterium]MBW2724736.1 transporter [Deltaproteobacteria bacterium]